MGLISFSLFILNYSRQTITIAKWFGMKEEEHPEQIVEDIHVLLLCASLTFILVVSLVLLVSYRFVSRVRAAEQNQQAFVEHKLHVQITKRKKMNPLQQLFTWHQFETLQFYVDYHHLRQRFLVAARLPASFDFSAYLVQAFRRNSSKMAEVHWLTWLMILGVLFLAWVKTKLSIVIPNDSSFMADTHMDDVLLWFAVCYGLLAVGIVIWLKSRKIYFRMILSSTVVFSHQSTNHLSIPSASFIPSPTDRLLQTEMVHPKKLFWFNNPSFMWRILQSLLLFHAFLMCGMGLYYYSSIQWPFYFSIILFFPSFVQILVLSPITLHNLALVSELEEFARRTDIDFVLYDKHPPK